MFFQNFPLTYFDITKKDKVLVTDFLRAIKIDPKLKELDGAFTFYEARDGETPEIISHKFYKTTQYHWVIMLFNEKFDPWNDFPQSDYVIQKLCNEKYVDINATHHYEDSNGNWVDQFYPEKIEITNIEFERQENEKKRVIKIPTSNVLTEFVTQYKQLIAI